MSAPATHRRERFCSVVQFDDNKANVFNPTSIAALNAALDEAEREDSHVVILTGRPGMYSGGLDLRTLPLLSDVEKVRFLRSYATLMSRLFLFPKPVIGACSGHALAGGCIMLLTTDIRIGAEGTFKIGVVETQISLVLPTITLMICSANLPTEKHVPVLLHGNYHNPVQARESGILHEVVAPEKLVDTAIQRAEALLPVHLPSYHLTKLRFRKDAVDRSLMLIEKEILDGFSPSNAITPG